VAQAIAALITRYELKRKLLVCGDRGSAADAEHIVGEMMNAFFLPAAFQTPTRPSWHLLPMMIPAC
tara:strand:+ start:461 stop:658 length:198 start_codon:yes stop_codon:yes gene_type:complete